MDAHAPGILRTLWQCIRNDPFDLCFEDASEALGRRVGDAPPLGSRQVVGRFISFFMLAFRAVLEPKAVELPIEGKILVLATSANQLHAVESVMKYLGAVVVHADATFRERMNRWGAL